MAFEDVVEGLGRQFDDFRLRGLVAADALVVVRVVGDNTPELAVVDSEAEPLAAIADHRLIDPAPPPALQLGEEARIGLDAEARPAEPLFEYVRVAVSEAIRGGEVQEEAAPLPGHDFEDDPAILAFLTLEDRGSKPRREASEQTSHVVHLDERRDPTQSAANLNRVGAPGQHHQRRGDGPGL